ncbi:MAG: hypothetical protein V3V78_00385 [Candidatus Woesearchaeota archaeon]
MNKLILNRDRAIDISKKAIEMLKSKQPPFNDPEVIPEMVLPKGVEKYSLDQALHLFNGVSMDSLRDSAEVYRISRRMVEEAGALNILHMGAQDISDLINRFLNVGEYGESSHDNPVRTIYENNQRLLEEFAGDPRNIFKGTTDCDEMMKRIITFRQYREGKGSLLIKNYAKLDFIEVDDPFKLFMKVDRHVVRMSVGTGALVTNPPGEYRTETKIIPMLRKLYQDICQSEKIDPKDLDDALWVIGSKICVEKDVAYCQMYGCPLECTIFAKMDKKGSYIHTDTNMRKDSMDTLFPNGS